MEQWKRNTGMVTVQARPHCYLECERDFNDEIQTYYL